MLKKALMLATVASLILTGNGCATPPEKVYVPVQLTRPARPVLPRLTFEDAEMIPETLWEKMVMRDLLRRQYAEQLEIIIDSTKDGQQ